MDVGAVLGSVWGDSGQVLGAPGCSGEGPREISGPIFFLISGQKKYENLLNKLFPFGSVETGAEYSFNNFLR